MACCNLTHAEVQAHASQHPAAEATCNRSLIRPVKATHLVVSGRRNARRSRTRSRPGRTTPGRPPPAPAPRCARLQVMRSESFSYGLQQALALRRSSSVLCPRQQAASLASRSTCAAGSFVLYCTRAGLHLGAVSMQYPCRHLTKDRDWLHGDAKSVSVQACIGSGK